MGKSFSNNPPLSHLDKVILTRSSLETEYQGYLETYYANGVEPDESLILKHSINWVRNNAQQFLQPPVVIELGSGGTIHHLIPFASLAKHFVTSDIRISACDNILQWKKAADSGGMWRPFVEFVLLEENQQTQPSDAEINARVYELKSKIIDARIGDLNATLPLETACTFEIVLCYYTTEVAALNSKERWKEVMHNLCSLVQPGGHLLMSCVCDSDFYVVENGDRSCKHAIPKLLKDDFLNILSCKGFDMKQTSVNSVNISGQEEHGLTGILLIAAKKLP